tara:strand:+ start:546 stop:1256 length:711 start_codon:yes stop_codon:yes gene_type:complete
MPRPQTGETMQRATGLITTEPSPLMLRITVGQADDSGGFTGTIMEELCRVLANALDGSTKLVVFQSTTPHSSISPSEKITEHAAVIRHTTQFQMALEILRQAAFFSIFVAEGETKGSVLDLALACDWRVGAKSADLCFSRDPTASKGLPDGERLAQLVGEFSALDVLLRQRKLSWAEASRIGLALPDTAEDFINGIHKAVTDIDKQSIAVMRHAVRNAPNADNQLSRIPDSLSVAV